MDDPPNPLSSELFLLLAYPYEVDVLALAVLALEGVRWFCDAAAWRSEGPRLSMLPAKSLVGDCFFGGEYAGGGGGAG